MAFNKKEYNFYKKLCKSTLFHVPNHEIYGCEPIFPPSILLKMLPEYIEDENFEACKAIKDSIYEWCNLHTIDIPVGALLKISSSSSVA